MARDISVAGTDFLSSTTDPPAVDISGTQLSLLCYFRCDTSDGNDRILVSKSQYISNQVQYNCGQQNNQFWFEVGNGGGTAIVASPAVVRVGHWHVGLGVLSGSSLQAHCDGRSTFAGTGLSMQDTGHALGFGVRSSAGGPEHDGLLGPVAIWAAALTLSEMYRLTVLREDPRRVRPEMLRGYWTLDRDNTDKARTGITLAEFGGTTRVYPGPTVETRGALPDFAVPNFFGAISSARVESP